MLIRPEFTNFQGMRVLLEGGTLVWNNLFIVITNGSPTVSLTLVVSDFLTFKWPRYFPPVGAQGGAPWDPQRKPTFPAEFCDECYTLQKTTMFKQNWLTDWLTK